MFTSNFFIIQAKTNITKTLRQLPDKSLHLAIDIWTSSAGLAILGVKCQYITEDWEMKSHVIEFKEFPETHTAHNIRNKMTRLITEELEIPWRTVSQCQ